MARDKEPILDLTLDFIFTAKEWDRILTKGIGMDLEKLDLGLEEIPLDLALSLDLEAIPTMDLDLSIWLEDVPLTDLWNPSPIDIKTNRPI